MSPRSFFASPGGVFACAGVTGVGGRSSKAAGVCVGRGDGSGLTGTVATGGGGVELEVCFGRPALAAGVGCATTGATGAAGTTGVATTSGGSGVLRPEL